MLGSNPQWVFEQTSCETLRLPATNGSCQISVPLFSPLLTSILSHTS
ncbi:hypothetical protein HMPREF9999_00587 [Alloprevotella sp. oral taxon 473 str. F0040]|nr:hypothetical protein HMPREF9999_00587 [Alloprevotella sp. oral taxon 473 str. F0040]